jgi:hypothetical protein
MSFVSFPLAMILSVFFQLPFGHDTLDKGKLTKDRQYHGQREAEKRETITWTKVFQLPFGHDIVCLLSASLCP